MAVGSLSRMALFLRKLLRIGTLPADMRAAVDEEGVIFLAEFVAVTIRFSGAVPGKSSATNVSSNAGALALTNQRVLGTLASVPKQAGRAVDHAWNSDNGSMVTATLDGAGLLLDLRDLSRVDKRFTGQLSLRYKIAIPDEVLAKLPHRTFTFDVPPEYVFSALGVRPK